MHSVARRRRKQLMGLSYVLVMTKYTISGLFLDDFLYLLMYCAVQALRGADVSEAVGGMGCYCGETLREIDIPLAFNLQRSQTIFEYCIDVASFSAR